MKFLKLIVTLTYVSLTLATELEDMKKTIDSIQEQMLIMTNELEKHSVRILDLEDLNRAIAMPSCHEYGEAGVWAESQYFIDPDGNGIGEAAIKVMSRTINYEHHKIIFFQANCTFEDGIFTTTVGHDLTLPHQAQRCLSEDCSKLQIKYENLKQVKKLIDR